MTLDHGEIVASEAEVHAILDSDGRLAALHSAPAPSGIETLLGTRVAGGFRSAVREALPGEVAAGSPLALVLDDLPVAALISGYAQLYSGDLPPNTDAQAMKADICSGWRSDGTMMVSVRAGRGVPVTVGPPAPAVEGDLDQDPLSWHRMAPLPIGAMRRRRLVDVRLTESDWAISAMFRDTHVDDDGSETVLHEYTLTATVDQSTHELTSCSAVPRVLPWVECPVAAASADRLAGTHVSSVREKVRTELRGTSTCTHLNDLLRSLGDIGPMTAELDAAVN